MSTGRERVGPWTLDSKLGSGGMGTVYLGTDGSRLAAVKVISPALAEDPAFRKRFRREIEICQRVTGDQVAELLDAGADDVRPWLAVRYVPGPTLRDAVVQHGPLAGETLRGFAIATAEALRQIHRDGVVHRDLKPSNVILTPDTPVIIDFGIAAASEATSLTATGMILGSAGWMAPEQVLGREVTPAADVFSWGALIAFAATGRPPFGEGRPEALSYRIVHGEPDLDGLEPALRTLAATAMSADPNRRPSIDQILQSLAGTSDATAVAAGIAMTWLLDGSEELTQAQRVDVTTTSSLRQVPSRRGRVLVPAVVTVVVAIFAAGTAYFTLDRNDAAVGGAAMAGQITSATTAATASSTTAEQDPPETAPSTVPDTTVTTTTEPPEPMSLRQVDWANRPYDIFCEDSSRVTTVQLDDGVWTSPDGPTYGVVDGFDVRYGDVTGDGLEEALVLITCAAGAGSNAWSNTVVMESRSDGVTQVGQTIPSYTYIVDGGLVGEELRYEDDDPMCCPSSVIQSRWILRNGGWSQEQSAILPIEESLGMR